MRKWLLILLSLAVVYILARLNTPQAHQRYPRLKRIDNAVTRFVWILGALYLAAMAYWFYDKVLR
jgi:hypothetical protein